MLTFGQLLKLLEEVSLQPSLGGAPESLVFETHLHVEPSATTQPPTSKRSHRRAWWCDRRNGIQTRGMAQSVQALASQA